MMLISASSAAAAADADARRFLRRAGHAHIAFRRKPRGGSSRFLPACLIADEINRQKKRRRHHNARLSGRKMKNALFRAEGIRRLAPALVTSFFSAGYEDFNFCYSIRLDVGERSDMHIASSAYERIRRRHFDNIASFNGALCHTADAPVSAYFSQ